MKSKYSNSKLFWMGFLGFIAAFFFLLAPLHEIWHVLFSWLHGYPVEVSWTGVWSDDRSMSMSLAGPFGELISFGAIFLYGIWRGKLYLAVFMIGYMIPNLLWYSIPGWMPVDFQIALGFTNDHGLVIFLFWICRLLNYAWVILASVIVHYIKKEWKINENSKNLKESHIKNLIKAVSRIIAKFNAI